MSERNGHSKGKIYKSFRGVASKSSVRVKSQKDSIKYSEMDSKTPPLPGRRTSIDELIKKRETLKQELKKITKHSDSDLPSKYTIKHDKNRKHSKNDYSSDPLRKRTSADYKMTNTAHKKFKMSNYSPEPTGDYAQVESEDEEIIIEKSRQRRKQLLEKLNVSQEKNQTDVNHLTRTDKTVEAKNENLNDNYMPDTKTVNKTTDMFSENDEFASRNGPEKVTQDNEDENNSQLIDNWDDAEGYYTVRVGDEIDKNRYTIKSILGQGVFSNVVRAQDNIKENAEVAIKIIRNNEVTYKTGLKEIEILKQIKEADPENKHHCINLIQYFMHKNHLCMVMEAMYMDLRHVIKKYGHHRGLNMKAIMSYSRQLLIALRLLKKIGVVHADIKPDNILVNEKKNVLKLCDFGSATKADAHEATPYLVSRFYRAPEIILGIPYKHSVDIWSAACTIYEMATGKIMFAGSSNNKMLKCFMDLKGKMSTKLIKKGKFKDQHFNYSNNFLLHKKDEHSGREKYIEMTHMPITRDLQKELNKYCKSQTDNEANKILQLKDLLDKMLILDLSHRYSVTDCLKHPFIGEELKK